jgi:hypothetical protein
MIRMSLGRTGPGNPWEWLQIFFVGSAPARSELLNDELRQRRAKPLKVLLSSAGRAPSKPDDPSRQKRQPVVTGDYCWSRLATSVRLFTNKVLKTLREVAQVSRPLPAVSKVDKGGSEHA